MAQREISSAPCSNKAAVEQEAVTIEGWTRESVTILETATGQQYRFVMPGPTFSEAEWSGVLERIAKMEAMPELIVASGQPAARRA